MAQFIPQLGDTIGASSCYFMFSAVAFIGTIFIHLFVPETRGKSEEEIRNLFSTNAEYIRLN